MSFLESSSDCFVVYIFSARARCPGLGRESDTICVASTLLMLFSSQSALAYFLNERQAQDFADKLAEVSPVAQNGAASSMFALLVGAAGYAGHYLEHGKKSPNAYLRLDPSKGANDNVLELVVRTSNQHIGLLQMAHMRCGESSIPNHAFHNSHELYITLYSCILYIYIYNIVLNI